MAAKFIVFAAFLALARASGLISAPVAVANAVVSEPYDPNPQYSYGYEVQDPLTGDSHGQVETRNGDVVTGSYALLDSDGTRRQVDYSADSINGFNAVVSKQPLAVAAPAIARVAAPLVAPAPILRAAPLAPVAPVLRSAPLAPILRSAPLAAAPLASVYSGAHLAAAPIGSIAPVLRSAPLAAGPLASVYSGAHLTAAQIAPISPLLHSAPLAPLSPYGAAPLLRSAPLAPLAQLRAAPLW